LSRPSTSYAIDAIDAIDAIEGVDARDKPGHDE
jgi:hypothetical protein